MRDILFRAQRVDNKEWVYGWVYKECGLTYIFEDRQTESLLNKNICYEVIPETVGQFTGLKDKNGVIIFEGDVLGKVNNHNIPEVYGIVEYDDELSAFIIQKTNGGFEVLGYYDMLTKLEIFGNEFDNPELLEEQ